MTKYIIALIAGLNLSAQAQWYTNSTPAWTNIGMAPITVPLSSNAVLALKYYSSQWSDQQGLVGTNRYNIKDAICYAVWWACEGTMVPQWTAAKQAEADARADVLAIKQKLNSGDCTPAQLAAAKTALGL